MVEVPSAEGIGVDDADVSDDEWFSAEDVASDGQGDGEGEMPIGVWLGESGGDSCTRSYTNV